MNKFPFVSGVEGVEMGDDRRGVRGFEEIQAKGGGGSTGPQSGNGEKAQFFPCRLEVK